jgi:hypothetical protein
VKICSILSLLQDGALHKADGRKLTTEKLVVAIYGLPEIYAAMANSQGS